MPPSRPERDRWLPKPGIAAPRSRADVPRWASDCYGLPLVELRAGRVHVVADPGCDLASCARFVDALDLALERTHAERQGGLTAPGESASYDDAVRALAPVEHLRVGAEAEGVRVGHSRAYWIRLSAKKRAAGKTSQARAAKSKGERDVPAPRLVEAARLIFIETIETIVPEVPRRLSATLAWWAGLGGARLSVDGEDVEGGRVAKNARRAVDRLIARRAR